MLKIAQFLISIKNMIELIMIFSVLYYFIYIIQSKIIALTLNKDGLTRVPMFASLVRNSIKRLDDQTRMAKAPLIALPQA